MPKYRTENIRNITLVGHTGCGKTSLVEALLVKSGKIGEAGTIERGTTTTDHDPLEKEFQHSIHHFQVFVRLHICSRAHIPGVCLSLSLQFVVD